MTARSVHSQCRLGPEQWADVEAHVAAFEQAWQRGERPTIRDHLPESFELRGAALAAMARVDMEWRINAGEEARVESYLRQFAELDKDPDAVIELIQTERDRRSQNGERASSQEYLDRFPELAARLRQLRAPAEPARVSDQSTGRVLATPAAAHGDKNLLFGILALQMDFLSRDSLISAMNAWVLEKSTPLGRILVDRGALSPARRSVLEALVDEHVAQHQHDPRQSLAALRLPPVVHRELERFADPDVRASMAGVRATLRLSPSQEPTLGPRVTDASEETRFDILRHHAGGGLGEVFVAQDRELHREVALKRLQERHADNEDSRARFVQEAEITGGLEHPGVVPVYGLGIAADGRPYYAMRFIRGQTLREAIDRFHAGDNRSEADRRIELRQLLTRFVAVCNAIEYAHSRGVIHRDIKPNNIMLGKFGETLVVDWGLAKALGHRDENAPRDERTLIPSGGSGSSETLPGSAIGTPAYMSPEQSEGQIDRVGPLSDVYSLGATLYAILTGGAPFESPEIGLILARVQLGDFVPPREQNPAVPRALDAICRKAMSLAPQDRYPSCAALALEIERWLADEPVAALKDPLADRTFRWIRRHRVLAASTVALVSAALVSLLAGTLLLGRANSEIKSAAREAQNQRDDANQQRKFAVASAQTAKEKEVEAVHQAAVAKARSIRLRKHAYRQYLQRAQDAISRGNRELALSCLELCPPQHRHWEWYRLQFEADSKQKTNLAKSAGVITIATPAPVWSMKWSPDGKRLAICGGEWGDKKHDHPFVAVWAKETGRLALLKIAFVKSVEGVSWSTDSRFLAAISGFDKAAEVWDVGAGRRTHRFATPGGRHAEWNLAGSNLLVGLNDRVAVLSIETGSQTSGVPISGFRLALSPDGRRLATGSNAGDVRICDAKTGQTIRTLEGHSRAIWCLRWSSDGSRLASASGDQTSRVWSAETGELDLDIKLSGVPEGVAWSPDGRRLVTAGTLPKNDETSEAVIFDARDGFELYRFPPEIHCGGGEVSWNPGGKLLALSFERNFVRLYDSNWPDTEDDRKQRAEEQRIAEIVDEAMDQWISVDTVSYALSTDQRLSAESRSKARYRVAARSQSAEWIEMLKEECEFLDALLREKPNDARLLARRGRCRFALQQYEPAIEDFDSAARLGAEDPWLAYLRGRSHEQVKDWTAAVADFRAAVEVDAKGSAANWNRRAGLMHLAESYAKLRRWSEAFACFSEIIDRLGDDETARLGRAAAAAELGKLDEASADLTRVEQVKSRVAFRPANGEGQNDADVLERDELNRWHRLALFQLKGKEQGGYERTCRHLMERFLRSREGWSPSQVAMVCSLGVNNPSLRAQAMELAEKDFAKNPKSQYVPRAAALALYRAGEFETALTRLKQSLANHTAEHAPSSDIVWEPDALGLPKGGHPEDWLLMAVVNFRLGRFDEARRWHEKASHWLQYFGTAEQQGKSDFSGWANGNMPWAYRDAWAVLQHEAADILPPVSKRGVAVGDFAKPIHVESWMNSAPIALDDCRGRVVLLEFWGVFCPPCLESMPTVQQWHERLASSGLQVIGLTKYYDYDWDAELKRPIHQPAVSHEKQRAAMAQFAKFNKITFPIGLVSDDESHLNYVVHGIPHYVLIDKRGKIRLVQTGWDKADDLESKIRSLLAESDAANK